VITRDAKGRLHVEVVDIKYVIAYAPIVGSLDRVERELQSHLHAIAARTVRKQIERDLARGVL